ncbi:patatin-like phospholipase family protein [Saccharospirillum salsuginis]|uniref:Patatin n=1 Tax=Saccharospirillum salsuginis TaxID=418750 RepID=A0A918K888_9GAMM|nr:patatin-like phospholipase family protein [Saccharospirillum salsuginis]GGX52530.1 patatin [Saccharospirillum salsuginis]
MTHTDQNRELRRHSDPPRVALALAGGGPLGGIYEVGALRALDEALDGVDFTNLYAYVGVSAGAVVAAQLANKITSRQLAQMLVGTEAGSQRLRPEIFFKPATREYLKRALSMPGLWVRDVAALARRPFRTGMTEFASRLHHALPPGAFDNEPIHKHLDELFKVRGRTNDFRKLANRLFVVSVELDTGEVVVFGQDDRQDVPISRAVQASTALPGLYVPVEMDGHYYVDGALKKTLHASVALDAGADLVICINPLVPYDANLAAANGAPKVNNLVDGGLSSVMSQTFRALIHSRMEVGMGKYATDYPDRDVVLFEPDSDDYRMFFTNVFSFSQRKYVAEHAYQNTRRSLRARRETLEPVLARHGIRIRNDVLDDPHRHFRLARAELDPVMSRMHHRKHPVTNQLSDALDRLQITMATSKEPEGRQRF